MQSECETTSSVQSELIELKSRQGCLKMKFTMPSNCVLIAQLSTLLLPHVSGPYPISGNMVWYSTVLSVHIQK